MNQPLLISYPPKLRSLRPAFLDHLAKRFISWRSYHATYRALNQLSDHQLEDIGIDRFDIEAVAQRLADGWYSQ